MFCTQCGVELGERDRFCSQCGKATELAAASRPQPMRLTRDLGNKKIAGVCSGFAHYLDVDVVLVRVLWLAIALCTGVGFIAYLVAWIIMPKKPAASLVPAPQHAIPGQPSESHA
jgi:phage shock protein PspC (stress-responsive transcriptional regulator)